MAECENTAAKNSALVRCQCSRELKLRHPWIVAHAERKRFSKRIWVMHTTPSPRGISINTMHYRSWIAGEEGPACYGNAHAINTVP